MPLIAKLDSGDYEPTPTGLQAAVCAFVEDTGYEPDMKGNHLNRKVAVLWELSATMKDGRPFMISKTYTLSLSEKANLRKDLESWRGKQFNEEELKGFDVEKLKGANCLLNILPHKKDDGSMTAKVANVMPAQKGAPRLVPINVTPPEWVAERRKKNSKNVPPPEPELPHEEPVAVAESADETPF